MNTDTQLDDDRQVRDLLNTRGLDGNLYMRLRGFYWMGPGGTDEPEFGYRDFRDSEIHQPIHDEAADLIAVLIRGET